MKRDGWSDLATFAAVAQEGSFTKAAARMGVSPSALSHTLRAMEARLGVRLLNRTTRSVAPTDAGEQLLARLRPAMEEVEHALEALNAQRDKPAGRVRISAHSTAATHALLPRLARFADDYPDVAVELAIQDRLVDIVAERFDAGVRFERLVDADMISVRIAGPQPTAVVATPDYFERFPPPVAPEDLARHRCLNYRYGSSGAVHRWAFVRDGQAFTLAAPGVFVTDDVGVLLEAALRGLGLASLPESHVRRHVDSGALVRALEAWMPRLPPSYLYFPSRRQSGAAFRAFVDAMRDPGS